MRWTGHVVRIEEMRNAHEFYSENMKDKDRLFYVGLKLGLSP